MINTASNPTRTLGFIRRILYSSSSSVTKLPYKSLVRPLEYCEYVWDPIQKNSYKSLKQFNLGVHRGGRSVLNDYNRTSSATAMKKKLDLESLELWRKITRVTTFHQHNQALSSNLTLKMQTILRPVQRSSRHGTYTSKYPPIKSATSFHSYKDPV